MQASGRARSQGTGYASIVSLRTPGSRCALVFLAASAILFAPATYERPWGWNQGSAAPIEARVLAPTVREGLVASSRLTAHQQPGDDGVPRRPVALAAVAAVAVLLAGVWLALAFPSRRTGPRIIFFRLRVPRGPPRLQPI
jgi:hypothetical protein